MSSTGKISLDVRTPILERNIHAEGYKALTRAFSSFRHMDYRMHPHRSPTIALAHACAWQIFMAARFGRWLGVDEMYERREEFKGGRLDVVELAPGPFDVRWITGHPRTETHKWLDGLAWKFLLITRLPSSMGTVLDSQAFPYDRVTDENELIEVMDLMNVVVGLSPCFC